MPANNTLTRNNLDKIPIPEGFEDKQTFLMFMRETFTADLDADRANREAALDDSLFVAGEQWDDQIRTQRLADNKPCITVNRLPAFIAQIVGNRRLNETVIKVTPDFSGKRKVAQLRQGLIHSIEKNSLADRAYNNAFQNAVICGIGNFGLSLEYASDDVFDQDIRINTIPNPLSVLWDRMSREPTGADARHCFVIDSITRKQFMQAYGDEAVEGDIGFDETLDPQVVDDGWATETDVRIVSFWRIVKEAATLGLFNDGDVRDITGKPPEEWLGDIVMDPKSGEPMVRERERTFAELHVCTANHILEGPYRLPIKRVPVFRVPGWEIDTAYSRVRFGLVRFAKDPQRMHNYWRSVIVEKLMLTPKAPWVASKEAVQGREEEWSNAHINSTGLLIYNGESGAPPRRTEPAQMEPALIQEAGMATQDMRDVTNLHEASFGQTSNEVSGKAITARQRVGELGTVIYQDNLDMAIAEAGKVMNDLIPIVYDTARVVKVVGMESDEREEKLVVINDETDEDSIDITTGKYSVSTTTGPSFVTRRIEAQESMLAMTNTMPDTMALVADLIVEAQDWPGADKVAARIRRTMPEEIVDTPEEDLSDEQKAQREQAQAEAAKAKELEDTITQLKLEEQQATTDQKVAQAEQARALAHKALVDADLAPDKLELDRDSIEIDAAKVAADIEQKDDDNSIKVFDFIRNIVTPSRGDNNGR